MKESYGEGVARHTGPESCAAVLRLRAAVGDGAGELACRGSLAPTRLPGGPSSALLLTDENPALDLALPRIVVAATTLSRRGRRREHREPEERQGQAHREELLQHAVTSLLLWPLEATVSHVRKGEQDWCRFPSGGRSGRGPCCRHGIHASSPPHTSPEVGVNTHDTSGGPSPPGDPARGADAPAPHVRATHPRSPNHAHSPALGGPALPIDRPWVARGLILLRLGRFAALRQLVSTAPRTCSAQPLPSMNGMPLDRDVDVGAVGAMDATPSSNANSVARGGCRRAIAARPTPRPDSGNLAVG